MYDTRSIGMVLQNGIDLSHCCWLSKTFQSDQFVILMVTRLISITNFPKLREDLQERHKTLCISLARRF